MPFCHGVGGSLTLLFIYSVLLGKSFDRFLISIPCHCRPVQRSSLLLNDRRNHSLCFFLLFCRALPTPTTRSLRRICRWTMNVKRSAGRRNGWPWPNSTRPGCVYFSSFSFPSPSWGLKQLPIFLLLPLWGLAAGACSLFVFLSITLLLPSGCCFPSFYFSFSLFACTRQMVSFLLRLLYTKRLT